jgi:hypothetical protein
MVFFFEGVTRQPPIEYLEFLLCERFGWTWQDINNQPREFINNMLEVMAIKSKIDRKNNG